MVRGNNRVGRLIQATIKVDRRGCWIWQGGKFGSGYGCLVMGGKQYGAHRASYEAFVGPIPAGMLVCHTCDVPACVNPSHLFAGTYRDNAQDMIRKGRQRRGRIGPLWVDPTSCSFVKLTWNDVHEIRASSESHRALAARFQVHIKTIRRVRAGRTWKPRNANSPHSDLGEGRA